MPSSNSVLSEEVLKKIDAAILRWDKKFSDIAKSLGLPKSSVKARWEEKFAISARQMITDGKSNEEIRKTLGIPVTAIAAFRANQTRKSYENRTEDEAVEATAIEFTISMERDLQLALRSKIEQIEKGLKIIDNDKEFTTDAGRIDILAEDLQGNPVVIELKVGEADNGAVAQILAYMGSLTPPIGKQIRGILIAKSFGTKAGFAAKMIPQLMLMSFDFEFTFEEQL